MNGKNGNLTPTSGQLIYQRKHQFGLFCHFGINTFNNREWSDGSLPAESFNPSELDAYDWATAAKEAGAAHLILTAKHHDGFCLWPTATSSYSVASSPWRDGAGDVVAEAARACHDVGVGFGVYLSPWDRHESTWANDHAAYDALYLQQLTELCTNYGELYEIWFDGAGSGEHPYDWDTIMAVVDRYQPQAMVFNMGRPTVRWVGNEDGLASDPCWYVVDVQHAQDGADPVPANWVGKYLPPECDVAIRRHWFWHEGDAATLKSLQHLQAIWYRSIGLGANLLLNVPPAATGKLDPLDRARLIEFGVTMRERFAKPIQAVLSQSGTAITATFPTEIAFDHLVLEEELEGGHHIRQHSIRVADGDRILVDQAFTVGSQRVHAFAAASSREVIVTLDSPTGKLRGISAHLTGIERAPELEVQAAFDQTMVH